MAMGKFMMAPQFRRLFNRAIKGIENHLSTGLVSAPSWVWLSPRSWTDLMVLEFG